MKPLQWICSFTIGLRSLLALLVAIVIAGPTMAAEVNATPIPPSRSAVFYMFCRLIENQSATLRQAESSQEAAAALDSILKRNELSEADWVTVRRASELALSRLNELAAERREIERSTPLSDAAIGELNRKQTALLMRELATLEAAISPAGQRALEAMLDRLAKNIVGVRLHVK